MADAVIYNRILLKLSGESLKGDSEYGIQPAAVSQVAARLKEIHDLGVEIACVIGGGNIFRGAFAEGIVRAQADYMGMLATVMNAIALQSGLETLGVQTRVQTAIEMREVAEPFVRRRAIRHLEKGRIVIFAAGTGCPFFTTDTTAALRANEIEAQAIVKATKVDGIYSADPVKDPKAVRYERISYSEALAKQLKVMDATAFSMCRDNKMPIIVCRFEDSDGLRRLLHGDFSVGTVVGCGTACDCRTR